MNANAKNLPEFKALIERYETITLEEIKAQKAPFGRWNKCCAKRNLTGFGLCSTCTLCRAVDTGRKYDCELCVYGCDTGCAIHETYDKISFADSPEALLSAYRARAKYMRTILKKIDHA